VLKDRQINLGLYYLPNMLLGVLATNISINAQWLRFLDCLTGSDNKSSGMVLLN
jgi:hypothetical protein